MGIHLLNTFLKKQRCNGINEISLRELDGKKIAIDTSIYLYRYKQQGALIEKMFNLCSILRYYNICPVFIFDGKASPRKRETLSLRSTRRAEAKEELQHCVHQLEKADSLKTIQLNRKISALKKRTTKLTIDDIKNVKILLNLYGMVWVHAKGEADELCAALVLSNIAYACLSEDTDMFVLGVPRILKYFSLIQHTCVLYQTDQILQHLHIDLKNFRHLCIISGTDYNKQIGNIFTFYELYTGFTPSATADSFLRWLGGKHISMQNYYKVLDIVDFYDINSSDILQKYKYIPIKNKDIQMKKLKKFLQMRNFMFC